MNTSMDDLRRANPYPESAFPEPTSDEYRRMQEAFKSAGLSPDRFFGALGRRVWFNACTECMRVLDDEDWRTLFRNRHEGV